MNSSREEALFALALDKPVDRNKPRKLKRLIIAPDEQGQPSGTTEARR